MHERGQAGLPKNNERALALHRAAVLHGHAEAATARLALIHSIENDRQRDRQRNEIAQIVATRQRETQQLEQLSFAHAAEIEQNGAALARMVADRRAEEQRIEALRVADTRRRDEPRAELARLSAARQTEEQCIATLQLEVHRQAEQLRAEQEQHRLTAEARRRSGAVFRIRTVFRRTPASNPIPRSRRPTGI